MADALGTIDALMTRVLGDTFGDESWATWRAVLRAAYALDLTAPEREVIEQLTGRSLLPVAQVRELWLFLGRRSGKSIVAALNAVWATCCRTYRLAPGEVGTFVIVAGDRRQARVIKRYVAGLLKSSPVLKSLLARETKEAIWLASGACVEIHTSHYRALRGYTVIGAAVDEVAFWDVEGSANPDHEVLVALRAAMASVPEAMLIGLTTLYARRGEVAAVYDKHYGNEASGSVLVVKGPTWVMNPTIDRSIINAAYEEDPTAAASEYGAEFRSDVEGLLPRELLDAAVVTKRTSLSPQPDRAYVAFTDPAGGSGTDSFTAAIAHLEGDRAVLDLVLERRPKFSPEATVAEFAAVLKGYRIGVVQGDRYAGSWPAEAFQKHGIAYKAGKTKSELYLELLPLVTSRRIELIDNARLVSQLVGLDRRTSRGGRDSVDHAPGKHDDLANAAAGALVLAAELSETRGPRIRTLISGEPWRQFRRLEEWDSVVGR